MPLAADQSTSANAATPVASKSGAAPGSSVLELRDVSIFYSDNPAVKSVSCYMERHKITAIIGPSGCGKSTLLRSLNRMNDFIPEVRIQGDILFQGQNLYGRDIDPVEV